MHLSPISRFAMSAKMIGGANIRAMNVHHPAAIRTVNTLSNLKLLTIKNAALGTVVDVTV